MTPQRPSARTGGLAAVLTQLSELGPPSEVRAGAPAAAAHALDFDRVLLSSVDNGLLIADALHTGAADAGRVLAKLRDSPVPLSYPLVEGEVMRRRRAQVVRFTPDESAGRRAFAEIPGWTDYVTAPVLLEGRSIGFLHADRGPSGRAIEDSDATALADFALCFALVFERAVLRHLLRVQRDEMRHVAAWTDVRTSELGDRSITLTDDAGGEPVVAASRNGGADTPLRDLLTRRELDVLELMVRGETNGAIARELVVSEGTVKFHVKNILRKLHASNRADATARYVRMTLDGRPRPLS